MWPLIKDMTESCSCFPPGYCRIGSLVLDHSQRLPLCYLLLHLWLRHCSCVLLSMQCSSPHVFFLLFHDYFFFYFQTLNECGERPSPPESTSDREKGLTTSFFLLALADWRYRRMRYINLFLLLSVYLQGLSSSGAFTCFTFQLQIIFFNFFLLLAQWHVH